MKKFFAIILTFTLLICSAGCSNSNSNSNKLTAFYNKVSESQQLLDAVADTIYSNWYDAVYKDKFNKNINSATNFALLLHSNDLERIESLEIEIKDLFKSLKNDKKHGSLVKDVMSAYSNYYVLVVNVSGSFKSYAAEKEKTKKELVGLLKDLWYEI